MLRCTVSILLLFTLACYQYVPAPSEASLPIGQNVRVEVTEEGARRLRLGELLPDSPTTLEGQVVTSNGGGLEVRVPVRDPYQRGFRERDLFQHVSVPLGEIRSVDYRQLNRPVTGIVLGAAVAALAAFIVGGLSGTFGGNTVPQDGDKGEDLFIPWSF
jgi:hypothetical protein